MRSLCFCVSVVGVRGHARSNRSSAFAPGIDLVTVDVVVLDRKGEPLQGLTRTDFTVLEDGKPQQIREFQSVELPAFAPGADRLRRRSRGYGAALRPSR